MHNYFSEALNRLKPRFNELTTFLIALTCVILFFSHPDFQSFVANSYIGIPGKAFPPMLLFSILILGGFLLSIFHVFTNRKKTMFEKTLMGLFAIAANGFAGIVSGLEILNLQSRWSIMLIFPILNLIWSAIIFYQIGLVNFEVTDENATLWEVIIATMTVLVIFGLINFGLHQRWSMTFSICIFYSSTVMFIITGVKRYLRKTSLET